MKTPKITIAGETASGKTALAYCIAEALSKHGIAVRLTGSEDETEKASVGLNWRHRLAALFAPKSDKSIEIETVRTRD